MFLHGHTGAERRTQFAKWKRLDHTFKRNIYNCFYRYIQLRSMSLTAEAIVELFERDARARKRLAELLVSEPDVRLAVINAVLRDVATKEDVKMLKSDIEKLRDEVAKIRGEYATKAEAEEIRRDLADVKERLAKLEGMVSQLITRIDDLKSYVDSRISDLDKRIDALDKRMETFEKSLSHIMKISWALVLGVLATLIANIVVALLVK